MDDRRKIHVDSFEEYEISLLRCVEDHLKRHFNDLSQVNIDMIKTNLNKINAYQNINHLEPMNKEDIVILDEDNIDISNAEKAILEGKFFWEHAAAGEAVRLGLGTKYLLNLKNFSVDNIVGHVISERILALKSQKLSQYRINEEIARICETINRQTVLNQMGNDPKNLMDMNLGNRHMFQMAYDVAKLAIKYGYDPLEILKKQKTLIILNESTEQEIMENFIKLHFFGLEPKNVYFMVQKAFHGIYIKNGELFYDKSTLTNKRLHNHGQMMMQKAHDGVIFNVIPETGEKIYISSVEYEQVLSEHDDMLSYNIEDIAYLTNSIDFPSLAKVLELGRLGYNMVMEIVANNPIRPQKGGACFYDPVLTKTVMIECDKLMGIRNEDILHLNKNFNHYPSPVATVRAMKRYALPVTLEIKSLLDRNNNLRDYLFICPPQGDCNFLLNTAFIMRKQFKPIENWKSPATTPITVNAMFKQDKQEGFKEFIELIVTRQHSKISGLRIKK